MSTTLMPDTTPTGITVGQGAPRRAFIDAHCRRLLEWFAEDGRFVHPGTLPRTRERLWNAQSLLEHGGQRETRLANAIIQATPIDNNGFQPIVAAELLMRHDDVLAKPARQHLLDTCHAHLLNVMEMRFGNPHISNFAAMTTWFLVAVGRLLPGYKMPHPLAGIEAVYTPARLRAMGLNAMRALTAAWHPTRLTEEFNSPTYTPITLHALANIASLIDDEQIAPAARQLEQQIWDETLAFYHPRLDAACGPYSRAYRVDILGQNALMRLMMAGLGLLRDDASIEQLLDTSNDHVVFHHHGDVPFCWAQAAWVTAGRYHLPPAAMARLDPCLLTSLAGPTHRRIDRPFAWPAKGKLNLEQKTVISVQSDALPAGGGQAVQEQHPLWALGYRTRTIHGQTFPIHLHYALTDPPRPRLQRHVTAAVMFHGFAEPVPEFAVDHRGRPVEPDNFNHAGDVQVTPTAQGLAFTARPLAELSALPTRELSLNSFIPLHFREPETITINGQPWQGKAIEMADQNATLQVRDHGFVFEIHYAWDGGLERMSVARWCRFLRFSAMFDPAKPCSTVQGSLRILQTLDGHLPTWVA